MIKPDVFGSEKPYGPFSSRGCDIWRTFQAARSGEVDRLRELFKRDANLYRAEYWYTQPLHIAVREGHFEVVRVLLDCGADPSEPGLSGEDPAAVARERGYGQVADLLEKARKARSRAVPEQTDHPIHAAVDAGNTKRVKELLDADPSLVQRRDRAGGTPLHGAVAASARDMVLLLLDRGADLHALHGPGPGSESGYAAVDFQPIDLALWRGPFWNVRGDLETVQLLLEQGAERDLTVAAALGDRNTVKRRLDDDPSRIEEARPCGKRPLSAAVEFGHGDLVRLLLDRGADPNWPEGVNAPRGAALHAAARTGDRQTTELLLEHGADPNSYIDSSGSATYAAKTSELRALLLAHGGKLNAFDMIWLGEDSEVVRCVTDDPDWAHTGPGGVFTATCTLGKHDLLVRILDAGAKPPEVLTECRSYLLHNPGMLRMLLDRGMNPDLPDWQESTLLHATCGRDGRGRAMQHRTECATILLNAGASISVKDEEYRSTPLAWAARNDLPDMVDLLLAWDTSTILPDDKPWATPLAWATSRGHDRIIKILRAAGATS